ncbi:F-box/LRR-repeat protein 25-like [Silene latifolia]|uniref:F-box/LRR-repeat protein 25-like n=1 Tax=Silene latifolia TaxID=37657 RepID=UPI003D77E884
MKIPCVAVLCYYCTIISEIIETLKLVSLLDSNIKLDNVICKGGILYIALSNSMAASYSAEKDPDNGEDYINGLPDDILLTMLSPMEFKDAAKTSILSKRWRNLWAQRTHLDFNHLVILPETDPDVENIDSVTSAQKSKYINWVNQVVDLHCIQQINTFRVCFEFDSNDAHHIHKWVKFALSKKVENLELNLVSYEYESVYSIGLDILYPPSLLNSGIGFLKTLHFCKIDVSGDFLEYVLSHCSLLERIHVEGSQTLVKLKVADLSCKLKQLIICYCHNLEELEVDAVDLIHLECNDIKENANVVFKRMPMLVEATFGWGCLDPSASTFPHLSHPFWAQITKLSLDFPVSA